MKKLLIKFASEISLKGLNRKNFENALVKNISHSIGSEYNVEKEYGRMNSINEAATFKVETKRADKKFPLNSMELSKKIGGIILDNIPNARVDIHNPDVVVNIEIRDNAYVYSKEYKGVAGMPYGTAGRGVLLLSGGIDSPVAGYMMAKRGLEITGVYYHRSA